MSDQYKRDLAQIAKDIGKIRVEISREEENARKARSTAAQKRSSAQRSTSQTTRDSFFRQADSEDKKVEVAGKKVGALHDKLSTTLRRQGTAEQSLRNAERNEQAAATRADEAKRREEKSEQDARNRADEQRRRKEKTEQDARDQAAARRRQVERDHAREISRLSSSTVRHIYVPEPEPEKLRVLYLTASPNTPNVPELRVDMEFNNVLRALRSAKHKNLVDFQHRPAATVEDRVDGLNDLRPHVVHFSGHAQGGLLFDRASLTEPGDHLVGYDGVARILSATDPRPTLVVLNACRTIEGAKSIQEAAAVVIATTDTVGDATSAIFATQFYAAIASAQTIGNAVRQAREIIAMALPGEPDVLTILAAQDTNPDELQLVKPSAQV